MQPQLIEIHASASELMTDEPGSPRPRRFTTPIELADLDLAAARVARRLHVFVAGPFIERGWSAEDRAGQHSSALLRVELTDHVQGTLGHEVVFGEHRGVKEVADDKLRSRSSPMLMELSTLKRVCDAVVIIPSSPGSYSELGSWAMSEEICRKMLILANGDFEGSGGYVATGVFKTAIDHGASLHWIDYADCSAAIRIVEEYISRIQDAVLARSIIRD